jgi:pyridoxamine 5'-phosphate oxidase family protein
MVRSLEAATRQIDETRNFVDRALRDFGLLEAFECRPPRERAECLRWIAASSDSCEEEDRVSCLLRCARGGRPTCAGHRAAIEADDGSRRPPSALSTGYGRDLQKTKKFQDVKRTGRAAAVIDDLLSANPWRPRGIEVRGRAEAVNDPVALIRLYPERVVSWGIESEAIGVRHARSVDR